jgi:hypothetical protein
MSARKKRRSWRIIVIAVLAVVLILAVLPLLATALFYQNLTSYIESDTFRAKLEDETAKGLHFQSGHYDAIKRTGMLTAESGGFQGKEGRKTIRTMDVRKITAKFNPWGVLLRRWQLDQVHVASGEVGIQVYKPTMEPTLAKPWFHIFLPQRVYLKRVESDPVDVTWRFREKRSGFFGTRLLITPHGRDFDYQATGGTFKNAPIPELRLRQTRMLITKTWLTLYQLDLASRESETGSIHAEAKAGIGEDKSVDVAINVEKMSIDDWLPDDWRGHIAGLASGQIAWQGKDTKLENSQVEAKLSIDGGRVNKLPFLEKLATLTKEKELEHLALNECAFDLVWDYPNTEIKKLAIEDKGKFRAEGKIQIKNRSLSGTVQLGVARRLLDWLPTPEEVFPSQHGRYLWTTVRLSGTIDKPEQDLSPRILEAIKESPSAALGLLFRQIGLWLKGEPGT